MKGQTLRGYLLEESSLFVGVEKCHKYVDSVQNNHIDGLVVQLESLIDVCQGNSRSEDGSGRVSQTKQGEHIEYSKMVDMV